MATIKEIYDNIRVLKTEVSAIEPLLEIKKNKKIKLEKDKKEKYAEIEVYMNEIENSGTEPTTQTIAKVKNGLKDLEKIDNDFILADIDFNPTYANCENKKEQILLLKESMKKLIIAK